MAQRKMLPVALEIAPGLLFQTFGIGHIYTGRVGTGLMLMFGYWTAQFINALLTTVLIGFLTGPLTFLAFMIFAPTNVMSEE